MLDKVIEEDDVFVSTIRLVPEIEYDVPLSERL